MMKRTGNEALEVILEALLRRGNMVMSRAGVTHLLSAGKGKENSCSECLWCWGSHAGVGSGKSMQQDQNLSGSKPSGDTSSSE